MACTMRGYAPHRHTLRSISRAMSASDRIGRGAKQPDRRDDHARRAVPALKRFGVEKGLLDRMQLVGRADRLDRRDRLAGDGADARDARPGRLAVDEDGAGAALALAASEFAAGEIELVAQDGQEAVVGLALHLVRASVDPEHESSHGPILPPSPGPSLLTWRAKLVYLRPVKCLVTGGAGFVGSSLALMLKRDSPDIDVTAFDNLRRRGSELALTRLRGAAASTFVHGDVRSPTTSRTPARFDLLLECSAEPSVHAGYGSSPGYVIQTNLTGTVNCLEAARRHRRRRDLPLDEPRLSDRRIARACRSSGSGDRLDARRRRVGTGMVAQRHQRGAFRSSVIARCTARPSSPPNCSSRSTERCTACGPSSTAAACCPDRGRWARSTRASSCSGRRAISMAAQLALHRASAAKDCRCATCCTWTISTTWFDVQLDDLPRYRGAIFNVGGGREHSVSLRRADDDVPRAQRPRVRNWASAPKPRPARRSLLRHRQRARSPPRPAGRHTRTVDTMLDDMFAWLRRIAPRSSTRRAAHRQPASPAAPA